MFVYYNPNPYGKQVGDCTVRALTMFLGMNWFDVYDDLYAEGREIGDMPSGNAVWASYLRHLGFENVSIVNMCPDCFTVEEFCARNPRGRFLLATGNHVVAAIDGNYYDSWDSGKEVPMSYWIHKGDYYANIR